MRTPWAARVTQFCRSAAARTQSNARSRHTKLTATGVYAGTMLSLGHVRTCMKVVIVCVLSCLSVVAADTNEVRVFTTTATNSEPGYLETFDVFTRGDQTNLVRRTQTKDGVVLFRAQTFYHHGAEMGQYIFNGSETIIGSRPGAP